MTQPQMGVEFFREQKAIAWIVDVCNDLLAIAPKSSRSSDVLNCEG